MKYLLVCDLDDTLTGNKKAIEKFNEVISNSNVHLVYSSGRFMKSMMSLIASSGLIEPDIIVANLGTEIYYGPDWIKDKKWEKSLKRQWQKEKIISILDHFDLKPQHFEKELVVSYYTEDKKIVTELKQKIKQYKVKVVHTKNQFLDIIPKKAGKGNAAKYLGTKMSLPIICCGDSENDEDMLIKSDYGVLVKNSSDDLKKKLEKIPHIHLANYCYANGVLEGLRHKGIIPPKDKKRATEN
ncbi:MAG: HAD-IIB family hydrolase [archaeon]